MSVGGSACGRGEVGRWVGVVGPPWVMAWVGRSAIRSKIDAMTLLLISTIDHVLPPVKKEIIIIIIIIINKK